MKTTTELEHKAWDLYVTIINDGEIAYGIEVIQKRIENVYAYFAKRVAKNTYNSEKALVLWGHFMHDVCRGYAHKEGKNIRYAYPKTVRMEAAKHFRNAYENDNAINEDSPFGSLVDTIRQSAPAGVEIVVIK